MGLGRDGDVGSEGGHAGPPGRWFPGLRRGDVRKCGRVSRMLLEGPGVEPPLRVDPVRVVGVEGCVVVLDLCEGVFLGVAGADCGIQGGQAEPLEGVFLRCGACPQLAVKMLVFGFGPSPIGSEGVYKAGWCVCVSVCMCAQGWWWWWVVA